MLLSKFEVLMVVTVKSKYYLLECDTLFPGRSLLMFWRNLLHPSSGQRVSYANFLLAWGGGRERERERRF
jgi:hypothetical protein